MNPFAAANLLYIIFHAALHHAPVTCNRHLILPGLQAALSPLLPPFMRGLGPLTTFFCNQLIATVETKYRDMAGSKEQARGCTTTVFLLLLD